MEEICFKCKTYKPELLSHPDIYTREVYRAISTARFEYHVNKQFIEWSSDINNLPIGLNLNTEFLFKDFRNKYPMIDWDPDIKYFNKNLVRLAEFEDLNFTFKKVDGVEWFMLGEPKNK